MLEIRNFEKTYANGFRLRIDSLMLNKGIHLVKGENGAGKSTLFKAIAGIHPFKGEIILDHISIRKASVEYRKLVNYAEAEPQYPDFLSLDELIQFVAEAKQASKDQIKFLKQEFNVSGYSAYRMASYSSGMLKKAALLLAFLGNPTLIILDEPFTTIDNEAQLKLMSLIKIQATRGVSFLISSHHIPQEDKFKLDSSIRISNGQLINEA